jgi:hypothetical protein
MGFKQSFSADSKICKSDLFGAVLAGFGIWTTPLPNLTTSKPQPAPSNVFPLRVIRVKEANPQMAGRMMISGRMADVCAELDRLAA